MSYLRTFLPWIVFAVLPSGGWQWAALTAILLAAVAHAGDAHSTPATVLQVAGFVVPMMFTVRYVAHVQATVGAR